ncbi:hypothetical protein HYFRA_00005474 [Hymenoscyphus fraxineus]|uniref:DUF6590 domain-containing protein n=1 Tax=Hymenoscyphus fraxineus TaxID=746836 RepID=A0A9N9KPU7_9HELO|nr:hypothetical protein HYFRA_00005474 [Hymenoscyphus fraxineus]
MGPSKTSSSKGKNVDKSTDWSEWKWDDELQRHWSWRYGPTGEPEYEYRSQSSQQQQETPRSTGESVILDNTSSDISTTSNQGSHNIQYHTGQISSTIATIPQKYASAAPASDSYYTTATAATSTTQGAGSRSGVLSYSTQPTFSSGSFSSATGLSSTYGSSASNYGNRAYDDINEVTSTFGGMSLNRQPTMPDKNYVESSGTIRRPIDNADREQLDPRYRVIPEKDQRKFWRVGRVFMMLWTEPALKKGGSRNGTHYSTVWLDEGAYSEIRRFVVIREGYGNSICSPIHTYNGQATLKANLPERYQHAIIYTGSQCPAEHSYEAEDGTIVKENLIKDPICVRREQTGPEGDLGAYSRLNYSKIYTVENYVRVLPIGMVEKNWIPTLNANSFVRPDLGPAQKPTQHKPPKSHGSDSSKPKDSSHKKGKDSRRSRR